MTRLRPKNWNEFQHYRRRSPPWVKLHKRLLDDFEFQSLPLASKALAPMLWLLASEDGQGWIDARAALPAFRDYCRKHSTYRPVHAERFLSERRFEGFAAEAGPSPAEIEANKDRADRLMRRGKYAVNYQ